MGPFICPPGPNRRAIGPPGGPIGRLPGGPCACPCACPCWGGGVCVCPCVESCANASGVNAAIVKRAIITFALIAMFKSLLPPKVLRKTIPLHRTRISAECCSLSNELGGLFRALHSCSAVLDVSANGVVSRCWPERLCSKNENLFPNFYPSRGVYYHDSPAS